MAVGIEGAYEIGELRSGLVSSEVRDVGEGEKRKGLWDIRL